MFSRLFVAGPGDRQIAQLREHAAQFRVGRSPALLLPRKWKRCPEASEALPTGFERSWSRMPLPAAPKGADQDGETARPTNEAQEHIIATVRIRISTAGPQASL